MKNLHSIDDLFLHELKDLYHAEKQLTKALPKLGKKVASDGLKSALEEHLEETKTQIQRLEEVFELLGRKPSTERCAAMEGLVKEAEELTSKKADPEVMDAAIISAAQKVEHYEIAGYGSLVEWAKLAGKKDIADILGKTLDEEEKADKKLTQLARKGINKAAAAG